MSDKLKGVLIAVAAIAVLAAGGAAIAAATGSDGRSGTEDESAEPAGENDANEAGEENEANESADDADSGTREDSGAADDESGPDDGNGSPITGSALHRASAVALDELGGGEVTGSEAQDEEGYYEIEVTRDGSQVDVHLDRQFNVIDSSGDGGDEG
jgi:hypothetical protein